MILDKQSRHLQGYSEIQLGLNSCTPQMFKQSAPTDCCTSDFAQQNLSQKYSNQNLHEINGLIPSIQQLKTRLLKLAQHKSKVDMRFRQQILLMNNDLKQLNSENKILKEVSETLRSEVHQMKTDLVFIKQCMDKKQIRVSFSPNFSKNNRQTFKPQRHSPRTKQAKLFRPDGVKIK